MATEDEDGSSPKYEIEIKGEGLTLNREIPETKVTEILGILLGPNRGEGAVSTSSAQVSGSTGVHGTAQTDAESSGNDGEPVKSIAQFMNEVGANNNFQKLAAIALYHDMYLGKNTVRRDKFPEWFEKAGLSVPKNLPRDIRNSVKRTLIAESTSEENRYYATEAAKEKLLGDDV